MIKTIIVDDEEHARNRLSYMLKDDQDVELISVCKNGIEAIEAIEEYQPDLVFLDIEMPEVNGFDVLNNVEEESLPTVIFVTAFSEYAVKAFEVNALDYVHKPFDKIRLSQALAKAKKTFLKENEKEASERLKKFLRTQAESSTSVDRFIVKSSGNIYIVKSSDVIWIEASGNYVNMVTEKKKHLLRSTMSGIKKKLDEDLFFQIHRSTIVNLDFVDYIEEWTYGDYKVIMKNGEELKMSRNYKELIQSI